MGTVRNGVRWRKWTYGTAGNGHQEEGGEQQEQGECMDRVERRVWLAMGGGTGLNSLF